jgi:dihydropteroate synthase
VNKVKNTELFQKHRTLKCKKHPLELGKRTFIMGILNITPDSFSDGGKYTQADQAVQHAVQMIDEGADIIDIGGESTRPGADKVSMDEELSRVIPIIKALKDRVNVPLSIDSYKANVADEAITAGAEIINDVWGMKKDPAMASVAAKHQCPVILMHNRPKAEYSHFLDEMVRDLQESIELAVNAGVDQEMIILDPGFGFGKTLEHNLFLVNHLHSIVNMGYPVLLGTSRKSMIHKTLGLQPNEVVEGTTVTTALGIAQGCQIIRVHDVKEAKKAAVMMDAISNHKHSFS